jgi:hypothetical protein
MYRVGPWARRWWHYAAAALVCLWLAALGFQFVWALGKARKQMEMFEATIRACRGLEARSEMTHVLLHACEEAEGAVESGVMVAALGGAFAELWPCRHTDPVCVGVALDALRSLSGTLLGAALPVLVVVALVLVVCGGGGCLRPFSYYHWGNGGGDPWHHQSMAPSRLHYHQRQPYLDMGDGGYYIEAADEPASLRWHLERWMLLNFLASGL